MTIHESAKSSSGTSPQLSRVSSLAGSFWKSPKETLLVGLTLLALATLSYGWMVIQPGLFGDDWPYLWSFHMFGIDGFRQLVAWDRPFSAFIYIALGPLFGEKVWAYHLALLISRWLCGLVFWQVLRLIWSEKKQLAFWSACLLVVYPGFMQQPHSLEFIHHISALLFFLLSLEFMLLSIKKSRWRIFYLAAGVIFSFNIFTIEYFIGLELLRPMLIWLLLHNKNGAWQERIKKTGIFWAPYLVVLLLYAYWRAFVFKFPTYQPTFLQNILVSPGKAVVELTQTIFSNLRAVFLGAWRQVFEIQNFQLTVLIIAGVIFLLCLLLFNNYPDGRKKEISENREDDGKDLLEPLIVGSLALILAGIPYWITGLPVLLEFPWDRSTLSFMLGVSILTAGLAGMLRPVFKTFLLAALVSLAVGFQLQNNVLYGNEWEKLRSFFWQLSWRAPSLEPGSIILSENIPLFYYSDNSLTPVLNWMYASDNKSVDIPYNFFEMGERLGKALPALEPGLPVVHGYRFLTFRSTTSSIAPVYFNPPGCVRILNPPDKDLPGLPRRLAQAVTISQANVLISNSGSNMVQMPGVIGSEPVRGWCYYFEKADLARQQQDWQLVASLGQEAEKAGLNPSDETEWLPFLEGYAQLGNLDQASELTELIRKKEGAEKILCETWKRILNVSQFPESILPEMQIIASSVRGCHVTN
jgi:hypothetical protein